MMMLHVLISIALYSELALSFSTVGYEQYLDVWRRFYAIPSHIMTYEDLIALGLENLIRGASHTLDLTDLGSRTFTLENESPLAIPQEVRLMFLFNYGSASEEQLVSEPYIVRHSSSSIDTTLSYPGWHNSTAYLPFELPKYHYIKDLFMMLPRNNETFPDLKTSYIPTADSWLNHLGLKSWKIPMSVKTILGSSHDRPIITFVVESSDTNNTQAARFTDKETFFDNFAKLWVKSFGPEALADSVFCYMGPQQLPLSYCSRVGSQGVNISLADTHQHEDVSNRNNKDSALLSRRFFSKHDDDCEDDDDGFDFLNIYDYEYETRLLVVNKLQKLMDFISQGLNEEDIDEITGYYDESISEDDYYQAARKARIRSAQLSSTARVELKDQQNPMLNPDPSDPFFSNLRNIRKMIESQNEDLIFTQSERQVQTPSVITSIQIPGNRFRNKLHDISSIGELAENSNTAELIRRKFGSTHETEGSSEDCVQVTWKLVFTYSLFGKPANFCTIEQKTA